MTMLWHYTVVERLRKILAQGQLCPQTAGVPKGEKPAVWFTRRGDWEPTANLMVRGDDGRLARLNQDQTFVLGGGLARIGVAPATAPHDWKTFKKLSGISPQRARTMYEAAVGQGSRVGDWLATFEPVPQALWLSVETWDDNQRTWVRMRWEGSGG